MRCEAVFDGARCDLEADHDGIHQVELPNASISWQDAPNGAILRYGRTNWADHAKSTSSPADNNEPSQ